MCRARAPWRQDSPAPASSATRRWRHRHGATYDGQPHGPPPDAVTDQRAMRRIRPSEPLRVLILDRTVASSPQAIGLAEGLRANGVEVRIGGPAHASVDGVVAVYPRAGVRGQRAAKLADAAGGVARFVVTAVRFRPHIVHLQWPGPFDLGLARLGTLL